MELVEYFGVLVRNSDNTWSVLEDDGHLPKGLISVTQYASGSNIYLRVDYPAFDKVGVCCVLMDETWCGKYSVGASVGYDHAILILRLSGSGTIITPSSLLGKGNIWFEVKGWVNT